ncbi:MAG TPA: hypothetical protein VK689_14385, partial [Armatimonadota bacterium]|nr:hypothetical protein [Armatimonadota bacterium]
MYFHRDPKPTPLQFDVGHTGSITCAAFSPDGAVLATGADDGVVILWDVRIGRTLHRLPIRGYTPHSLAFSPNGATLAVGAYPGLELWEVLSGQWQGTFPHLSGPFVFVGPERLVAASRKPGFMVVDSRSGQQLREVEFDREEVRGLLSVALSADGSTAATATYPVHYTPFVRQEIQTWDLAEWRLRARFWLPQSLPSRARDPVTGEMEAWRGEPSNVSCVELSPNGQVLAIVAGERAWLAHLDSMDQPVTMWVGWTTLLRWLAFSPDGRLLALVADHQGGAHVSLWRGLQGKRAGQIFPGSGWLGALAFSPDSRTLVTGGSDRVVKLWNVDTGGCLRKLRAMEYAATGVAWSPDGRCIAAIYSDGTTRLWNAGTGDLLLRSGGEAVASGPDGAAWDPSPPDRPSGTRAGYQERMVMPRAERTRSFRALSSDGRLEAVAYPDREGEGLQAIDIRRAGNESTVSASWGSKHKGATDCLCFSADGSVLVGGDYDNGVWVWDTRTGELRHWLYTRTPVGAVAVSPDNRFLVAGEAHGGEVWVWDLLYGKVTVDCFGNPPHGIEFTLKEHAAGIRGIAFSPDGR